MKKTITRMARAIIALLFCTQLLQGQNNLGINNPTPDASAALHVDTAATGPQGILIPRMTQARRNAIANPAPALMIYQTDGTKGFYYNSGTAAMPVWSVVGVSGIPTGGIAGQVLSKVDATDNNTQWVTPNSGSATIVLRADKTGGASQSIPVAGTTSPTIIAFENVVGGVPSGFGSYVPSTGIYTTAAAGMYMVTVNLLGPDNSPTNNSVPYCINLIINNTAFGTTTGGVIYGLYPSLSNVTTVGIKSRGSFSSMVYLGASDNIRVAVHGGNSAVIPTNLNTNASCNISIVKM